MIPRQALTSWSRQTPWGPDEQIAQDLFLCAVAVEVALDAILAGALAWRGGTCLHRLHLPTPYRYSEDLDYVLLRGGATYAQMTASLRVIADRLGAVMSAPERSPIRYVTHFEIGAAGLARPISIKLEINSADAEPALDLVAVPLAVHALGWRDAEGAPLTYQVPELLGTKFRAISERKKGRDLWDIYHATSRLRVADAPLAACAAHYLKYHDIMPSDFRQRLAANLLDPAFRQDMDTLIVGGLGTYDPIRFGRALIVWSDQWLDPRLPAHAQRKSGSPTDGLIRCPTYEWQSGNLTRCGDRVQPGATCPTHRQAVESWIAQGE